MNNKIAGKLYSALVRFGTPPDIAKALARSTEFLGESTEETLERDEYEAMIAARAMSGIVKRHAHKITLEPELKLEPTETPKVNTAPQQATPESKEDVQLPGTTVSQKTDTVQVQIECHDFELEVEDDIEEELPRKNGRFWTWLEKKPRGVRATFANVLPVLMYVGMILLTALIIGLIASCLITIIGMTVAGIALFIIGLLYGVSQLTVFPAAAYYEIGLGLIIGGTSVLLIILVYNLLTRLLPFLLKKGIKRLAKVIRGFKEFKKRMKAKAEEA